MLQRALQIVRARSSGSSSPSPHGRLLAVGANLIAPVALARLLGEASFLAYLMRFAIGLGIVFAIRAVSHLVLWNWRLYRGATIAPERRRAARMGMAAEAFVAVYWLAVGWALQAAEPTIYSPAEIPLTLIFLVSLAVIGPLSIGLAGTRAEKAGLSPTTDVFRGSPAANAVKDAANYLARLPPLRALRDWLRGRLPAGKGSGVALFLVAGLLIVCAEGTYAVYTYRLERMVERRAIEIARGGASAEAGNVDPPTPNPEPGTDGGEENGDGEGCQEGESPGEPAPRTRARALYALWYGDERVEGEGSAVAGCPQPAEQEPGRPQVWVVRGVCEGRLEGLGVAAEQGASMLLQQAAEIAYQQVQEGILLSASARVARAEGDLYLLQTVRGTYALTRAHRSAGSTDDPAGLEHCGEYSSENVPYSTIPPGLIGIWTQISSYGWTWPVEDASASDGDRRFAFLAYPSGELVARAGCVDDLSCTGTFRGQELPLGATTVSMGTIMALAPPPP